MTIRCAMAAALLTLLPATARAGESLLRGSPASMHRQHNVALEEELTFYRTPAAVQAEVAAGTLTAMPGNDDYRVADVSFAYAIPEVRLLVERLARQYRAACGEQLVVTSLTRPRTRQPSNAHVLSVHPAGMAVDLRISQKALCRNWVESTLLSLEEKAGVLDVTRERHPPHYHVAVFPTAYRQYVERLEALKPKPVAPPVRATEPVLISHAAIVAVLPRRDNPALPYTWLTIVTTAAAVVVLAALRLKRSGR